MCGKGSRIGIRGIAIGSCLLLLLASPCFAASSWEAIFSGSSDVATHTGSLNPLSQGLQEASSQAQPTGSQEGFSEKALRELQKDLEKLRKMHESLEEESTKLETSATALLVQSQNSLETGKITEAQYAEMLETAESLAFSNRKQADRLAELEAEAGTKAYLMLDGIVGFKDSIPQFGAGVTVGARIGSDLMVEAGADYMIGGVDGLNRWSLDNWQFRAGVGWMF